ncbi:MAG: RidA family protein [Chloroflexi bacterium]|nr:RidA family protein [Chloroflexota bacterium]MCY3583227.1 RidA family protein [Chloroflexota bacterium]MCY3717327.1 RidA family protein [Chloroflexota bacterium]MDE2651281.1 RidA family protein [Chloroflexota bacterium]MXV92800.1 RidA family protein [Chloroflexota bacterium]
MKIEAKLAEMGLALPPPILPPPGVELPFSFVRLHAGIAYISGHGPQHADGSLAGPFGKVGADVSVEAGYAAARAVALSMLGSLKRSLGDLDRVSHWLRLHGMVNCAPDFAQQPAVINGCSQLILALYGAERGAHARSAVGMQSLPFNMCVEIEGAVAYN